MLEELEFIRWLLIAQIVLQLGFLGLFLRSMSNMVDGFNQSIKGLQTLAEELQRLRAERR
jgi:hypothetical protein